MRTSVSTQQAYQELLDQISPFSQEVEGYKTYCAQDAELATEWASRMLGSMVNRHSLLMMYYDTKLHPFYSKFAGLNTIEPLAIMMAEEVFGAPFHLDSCEHSLKKLGFIDAISKRGVPFFRILSRTPTITSTIRLYGQQISSHIASAREIHVILEVDGDGGLGGIPPAHKGCSAMFDDARSPLFGDYLVDYSMPNIGESAHQKITATYKLLDKATHIWAFAFGKDAGDVMTNVFNNESLRCSDVPAARLRQYRDKVYLFTDQAFF